MSDSATRDLERRAADDPSLRPELVRAWVASGRGWHGEDLPSDERGSLSASEEEGVYLWRSASGFETEMVRVPEGQFRRLINWTPRSWTTEGFWIGRYPVTWREWLAWPQALKAPPQSPPWRSATEPLDEHPVVNVTPQEMLAFCQWAGLDLPDLDEWEKAARGGNEHFSRCLACLPVGGAAAPGRNVLVDCPNCRNEGRVPRAWPWGDEDPTAEHAVLSPVAGDERLHGTKPVVARQAALADILKALGAMGLAQGFPFGGLSGPELSAIALAMESQRRPPMVPARPRGASPYGAYDMAGNVSEAVWDQGWMSVGGSWRTHASLYHRDDYMAPAPIVAEHYSDSLGLRAVLRTGKPGAR